MRSLLLIEVIDVSNPEERHELNNERWIEIKWKKKKKQKQNENQKELEMREEG